MHGGTRLTAAPCRQLDASERPEVEVERPANPEHGDLATNLALKLARPMRRAPLQIAEALASSLRDLPGGQALRRRRKSRRPAS